MKPLGELPGLVLGPLQGRSDAEWERGPAGRWTPAQIVEHLALGLTLSAETFLARRHHAPMKRRRRSPAEQVARLFIMGLRWFPPGRKAPERTTPAPHVTRAVAEPHFLAGIELWDQVDRALLPERRNNLFVKHPRLGDLTVEEWLRFHETHARHHARQIRERIGL
jgi:DinB superfamily